jgi:hypothetical protein
LSALNESGADDAPEAASEQEAVASH